MPYDFSVFSDCSDAVQGDCNVFSVFFNGHESVLDVFDCSVRDARELSKVKICDRVRGGGKFLVPFDFVEDFMFGYHVSVKMNRLLLGQCILLRCFRS